MKQDRSSLSPPTFWQRLLMPDPHELPPTSRVDVEPGTIDPTPPTLVPNADEPDYFGLLANAKPHELDALFSRLDAVFSRDKYEVLGPFVFGGPGNGSGGPVAQQGSVYEFRNPFQTPCEWCLIDTFMGGPGECIIGPDEAIMAPTATISYDPSQALRGIPFGCAGVLSVSLSADYWFPLNGNDSIYLNVNVQTAKSGVACVCFRRARDRRGMIREALRP